MNFVKMQGTGNDFVIFQDLNNRFLGKEEEIARKICDRHFGIGADGILIVRKSNIADIQMVIINADGSYASMCGNGIRCFAKYVWEEGLVKNHTIEIETGDGVKQAFLDIEEEEVKTVTINMGIPSFNVKDIPAECTEEIIDKNIVVNNKNYNITSMLMGVPHTVVLGNLDDYNVEEGKYIEIHRLFPKRTNVNFCEVVNKNKIRVKTWERGAGPTLACGTGSCACAVACNKLKLTDSKVDILVPGGNLVVQIKKEGIFMTGPAVTTFKGEYNV